MISWFVNSAKAVLIGDEFAHEPQENIPAKLLSPLSPMLDMQDTEQAALTAGSDVILSQISSPNSASSHLRDLHALTLLDMFKVLCPDATIECPNVVIMGQESAGKTTLLHRMAKLQLFSVKDRRATFVPTQVKLRYEAIADPIVEISYGHQNSGPIHVSGGSTLSERIETIVKQFNVPTASFSNTMLIVSVRSPHVVNCEFVDLPGIIANPPADSVIVRDIAKQYVSDPASLVLLVESAGNDRLNNSLAVSTLTEVRDGTGGATQRSDIFQKTMLVLTKADILTKDYQKRLVDTWLSDSLPTESADDIDPDVKQLSQFASRVAVMNNAAMNEDDFFLDIYTNNGDIVPDFDSKVGIGALFQEMNRISRDDLLLKLRAGITSIGCKREACQRELQGMGLSRQQYLALASASAASTGHPATPVLDEQIAALQPMSVTVSSLVQASAVGTTPVMPASATSSIDQIIAIRAQQETFWKDLQSTASRFEAMVSLALSDAEAVCTGHKPSRFPVFQAAVRSAVQMKFRSLLSAFEADRVLFNRIISLQALCHLGPSASASAAVAVGGSATLITQTQIDGLLAHVFIYEVMLPLEEFMRSTTFMNAVAAAAVGDLLDEDGRNVIRRDELQRYLVSLQRQEDLLEELLLAQDMQAIRALLLTKWTEHNAVM